MAGSRGKSVFGFARSLRAAPTGAAPACTPTAVQAGSLFSTPSAAVAVCGLVNDGHSGQAALDCGSKFFFRVWSDHGPFLNLVSQLPLEFLILPLGQKPLVTWGLHPCPVWVYGAESV